jgi:hypothetical protein
MTPHYLKFESKEQYLSLLGDDEFPAETSVVFPVLSEPTGNTLTDENGEDYPEYIIKAGYHVNVLGDYPASLAEYEIEVDTPSVKWAGF